MTQVIEVRIVILDIRVSISECMFDDISVGDTLILRIGNIEHVWFLGSSRILVVVTCEGIEGTKLVPSCAEIGRCITIETTDVTT